LVHFTHKITLISLCIMLLLTSMGLTTLGARPGIAAPVGQTSQFQPTPCMFDLPGGAIEGTDVVCGYLTVPEEHSQPGGSTIQLAVAIIKSQDPNPKSDPLFIAQGGPGGSTIETYATPLLSNSELRASRDIVLFDQRGTLYSKPDLYCKEIDRLTADTIEKVLTREETEKLNLFTLTACRERLAQEGINLSAFDSLENADDIESLRLALSYDRINLYGVSYGTLLALHYMHNYPGSLRSVILDGVVPPQTNFILGSAKTMDQSFSHLMEACRLDEICNNQYPDLENVFFKLVSQLNQTPARISMTDPETGTVYHEAALDGDTFMSAIFQFLYIADLIPALPRMIYDAQQGDFSVLARILSIIVFDRSMSYGMYYSVVCSEEANFTPAEHDLSGVRPIIAEIEQRTPQSLLDICQHWNVKPLDPQADQPVESDIPTLLLSGGFDPITPPEYAASVASTLTKSYSFTFPTGGHGQMLDDDCPNSIILAFLDDPTQAPDSSCIDNGALPDFITSQNTIYLPVVTQLLNLAPVATFGFLSVMILLLFMWTSLLVFPLAWLIGRSSQKTEFAPVSIDAGLEHPDTSNSPGDQPRPKGRPSILLRISSWLPVIASASLSLFWLAYITFLVIMITKNDNRLFYGLAIEAQPWFALILIFLLLCLMKLAAAILGWAQRYGPLWRRVYYTLLTLAGLTILVILAAWGMLTILL
jgi:pimeloyl-ACP methyl ester carboxylesterase